MKIPAVLLMAVASCLLAPAGLPAQSGSSGASLFGTWYSTENILVHIKFSLTFTESEYVVDCTLGQTVGTWVASTDHIFFTPVKIGINAGDVGKSDTWTYRFVNEDSFVLASGPISVQLFRKR